MLPTRPEKAGCKRVGTTMQEIMDNLMQNSPPTRFNIVAGIYFDPISNLSECIYLKSASDISRKVQKIDIKAHFACELLYRWKAFASHHTKIETSQKVAVPAVSRDTSKKFSD